MKRILLLLALSGLVCPPLPARAEEAARTVVDSADTSRSSWLEKATFEKEAGAGMGRLQVRIKGEDITYLDVPVTTWLEFRDSDSMGAFYGERIRQKYERVQGEPLSRRHDSLPGRRTDAKVQCAFNEECETLLLHYVEQARESILVAAYAFTRTRIAAALVSAHVRGVAVTVKMDSRQAEYPSAARTIDYLSRNGVPVTRISMQGDYAAMHNKFLVIDGQYVLAGSYNFTTTAGTANWENLLAVDSPEIAGDYAAAWKAIVSD